MHVRAEAIVCAARAQGETGVIARLLTEQHGLIAAYVAGGRGRRLRPVLIPGNLVAAEIVTLGGRQLPFARLELAASRGPWLGEPLPAAAIIWAATLTAVALPERHAYAALYAALVALLDAVCHAPSARGWLEALVAYEALLLRELGYGGADRGGAADGGAGEAGFLDRFDRLGAALARYPLADRYGHAMAARTLLRERLLRIAGDEGRL